jgi:hypothetical protein
MAVRLATMRSWETPRDRRSLSGTTSTMGRRGSTRASASRTACAARAGSPDVRTCISFRMSSGASSESLYAMFGVGALTSA